MIHPIVGREYNTGASMPANIQENAPIHLGEVKSGICYYYDDVPEVRSQGAGDGAECHRSRDEIRAMFRSGGRQICSV